MPLPDKLENAPAQGSHALSTPPANLFGVPDGIRHALAMVVIERLKLCQDLLRRHCIPP
jgi:hypothetical protein